MILQFLINFKTRMPRVSKRFGTFRAMKRQRTLTSRTPVISPGERTLSFILTNLFFKIIHQRVARELRSSRTSRRL